MTEFDLIRLVSNFGAFALLAWLVFHVTRHTLPDMIERFTVALETQQKSHEETMKSHEQAMRTAAEAFAREQDASRQLLTSVLLGRIGTRRDDLLKLEEEGHGG